VGGPPGPLSSLMNLDLGTERASFVTHAPEFEAVLGDEPRLELVAETDAHEGPIYAADEDALYFTTVRRDTVAIKRLALADGSVSVVRADANMANGMTLDREGRLVVCEQGTLDAPARITRLDGATGEVETVVEADLNSPNDVVVKSDGTIWFTDPSYGYLQGFRPAPRTGDYVYRYDPESGDLAVAADSFDKPNGIAFSPEKRVLYVADNGEPHELLAFDVDAEGRLSNRRQLAVTTPEHPDGLKTDSEGRIYASFAGGVQVLDRTGALIGELELPGAVNFTFGGPRRNILYITSDTAIWAATLNAKGA
jgi:gluconolactonase